MEVLGRNMEGCVLLAQAGWVRVWVPSPWSSWSLPAVDRSGRGDSGLWSQTAWTQVLAASLPSFVVLGRLINVSVPQFPYLQTGITVMPFSSDHYQD